MAMQVQPLTSTELNKFVGRSLYVLNTSDRGGNSRSQLLMTFNTRNGNKTVVIFNTWIPIDLTTQIPDIESIKSNEDFLYHFRRKTLMVISEEAAIEVLDQPDAIDEYNRIYNIAKNENYDDKNSMITIGVGAGGNTKTKRNQRIMASTKVLSIMNKKEMSEVNRLASLKNIVTELTEDDYKYILNLPKSIDNEKIKAWASSKID